MSWHPASQAHYAVVITQGDSGSGRKLNSDDYTAALTSSYTIRLGL